MMQWTFAEAGYALRGLDAAFGPDGKLYVTGYDREGLWLVMPESDFAREKIDDGTADHTREGTSFFGATAVAFDSKGAVVVAYDKGKYPRAEIRCAVRSGGSWTLTTLAEHACAIGETGERQLTIAFDARGEPVIGAGLIIGDARELALLRAGQPPEQLGIRGDALALAFNAHGTLHAAFCARDGGLRYGSHDGRTWTFEDIASDMHPHFVALALDPAGRPHVAYHASRSSDALGYAVRDGSWRTSLVDKLANSGFNLRLGFAPEGRARIGQWTQKSRASASSTRIIESPLRWVGERADGTWFNETVAPAWRWSASALAPDGRPHFVYVTSPRSSLAKLAWAVGDGEPEPGKPKKAAKKS